MGGMVRNEGVFHEIAANGPSTRPQQAVRCPHSGPQTKGGASRPTTDGQRWLGLDAWSDPTHIRHIPSTKH